MHVRSLRCWMMGRVQVMNREIFRKLDTSTLALAAGRGEDQECQLRVREEKKAHDEDKGGQVL